MNYSKYLLGALLAIGFITTGFGRPSEIQEFKRTITEEFEIKSGGTIDISNKYGNVDIQTSDDNKVSFVIEVIVETKDEDRARDIMNRINIAFNNSSTKVEAVTKLYWKNSRWRKKNESYKINYTVMMPKDVDLELYNKYGDISVTSIEGDAEIELHYGNGYLQDIGEDLEAEISYVSSFEAGNIDGDFNLDASYSHFTVGNIGGDGDIGSKYSDVTIEEIADLTVESNYDEYYINTVGEIDINGKYDDFHIEHCGFFEIDAKYTDVKINTLARGGDFYTGYGSVRIKNLHQDFKQLEIESEYTGYGIGLQGGAKISLASKYTDLDVPSDTEISYRDRDGSRLSLKAHYKDANAGSLIAEMRYGSLKLKGN